MPHLLYGYRIESGKAEINLKDAEQVKELFKYYIEGLGLSQASKITGINRCHTSIGRMLSDKRYLFDAFYPSIVDKELFDKAQEERGARAKRMGRIFEPKEVVVTPEEIKFLISEVSKKFDDPFKQAEYAYSQIKKSEVMENVG